MNFNLRGKDFGGVVVLRYSRGVSFKSGFMCLELVVPFSLGQVLLR